MLTGNRVRRLLDACAVLVAVVVATDLVVRHGDLTDLHVYRYGGRSVLDGLQLYRAHDPATGLPFTYPPFAAVVLVPLTAGSFGFAAAAWTAVSVACLAAVVSLSLREAGVLPLGWLVALLMLAALAFEPVWQNLTFGQVNLVLMLAVLVDVLQPGRRWSGVLVGIAAGVKLTPLVFVILLVLVGRRTAAGRAVVVFAATVLVGWWLVPGSSAYWNDRLLEASRVGPPALAHNQSAYGVLTRLLDAEPARLVWLAAAVPLAAAALVVAALWWRRGDRLLGCCLTALAMLLASPVSWSHHWVWAVPLAVALCGRSRLACLAWTGLFVARPVIWPPYGDGAELDWSWSQQLLGNSYFLGAVLLVAWLGAELRRQAASAAVPKATEPGITVGGQSQASSQGR